MGRRLRTLHIWGRMSLRTRTNLRNKLDVERTWSDPTSGLPAPPLSLQELPPQPAVGGPREATPRPGPAL